MIRRVLSIVAIALIFLLPSFFVVAVTATVNNSSSQPLVSQDKKYSFSITAPQYLFNGVAQSSTTVTYSFLPSGSIYWDGSGDNFTIKSITFDNKRIIPSGIMANSTTTVFNFNKTNSVVNGSIYFKQQKSNGYTSTDLKVTIVGTSRTGGNLCFNFDNPNQKTVSASNSRVKFGGKGFDWSDSMSKSPSYSAPSKSLCYAVGLAFNIDPVTIGTSTINEGVSYSNQRNIVFANTRWWMTYSDGTNCRIRSSTDGVTWGGAVTFSAFSGCSGGWNIGTALNGNNLYYGVGANTGTTFQIGAVTLNSDGTKTSLIANTSVTATNAPANFMSVANDGTNWWVVLNENNAGTYQIEVFKCTTTCGTNTNWVSKKIVTASTTQLAPIILDLTSGVAAIYGKYGSDNPSIITSATGASWSSPVTTTSTFGTITSSATRNGDNVYFAGVDTTNNIIKSWTCAYPCSSTPTEVTVESATSTQYWVTETYDSTAPSLTVVYGTASTIYYRESTDGGSTWSARATIASSLTIPAGSNYGARVATSPLTTSSGTVAAGWEEGGVSPFNVRFTTQSLTINQVTACTMNDVGAVQGTVAITGGLPAPNPSNVLCDGANHNVTVQNGITLTATEPVDGGTTRYRFSGGVTTTTVTSSTSAWTFTNYYELKVTVDYSITGGGSPSVTNQVSYTSAGAAATSNMGSINVWADYKTNVIYTTPIAGGAGERWNAGTVTFLITASQGLVAAYYHQYSCTCSYSVTGGGSPTAPVLTGKRLGSVSTDTLSTTPATVWLDNSQAYSATNPTTGSSSSERWDTNTASGTVSAAFTFAPAYYHQYALTASYSISDSSSPTAPTLTGKRFGSASTDTLTTSTTAYWEDNSQTWSVTNPLTGSSTTQRWVAPSGTSGTVSAAATTAPTYYNQAVLNNPSALSITRTNNNTAATTTSTKFWCDIATSVTVSGVYSFAFRCAVSVQYVNQEPSQGFGLLSNVAISGISYVANPNRLTWVGMAATNTTVYEASPVQLAVGTVNKFYSNGNPISTYTWSISSSFFNSGSVSCTTNCELDFSIGGGGPTGGGPTGGGPTGGGPTGGGSSIQQQTTSTTTKTITGNYVPPTVGNPDQLTVGLVSISVLLGVLVVVRYVARETDLDKLGKGFSGKTPTIKSPKLPMFSLKIKRTKKMP